MAGLGSVKERVFVYLTIAGGYIWNKKADKNDPDYGEQAYKKQEDAAGTMSGLRTGAQYEHIDGTVKSVVFKQHEKFGESINVTMDIGADMDYILSVSTNNRYSQDLMKALLLGDLDKPFFVKPYDFIGSDKKRASGITFKQDGTKLSLKVEEAPSKDGEWFKNATKKAIKRFFEDLNDWYVAQVEELVVPKLDAKSNDVAKKETATAPKEEAKEQVKEEVKEEAKVETPAAEPASNDVERPSPIKMKRAIKAYMAENYEGVEMPKLSGDTLIQWYDLVQEEEELPIEDNTSDSAPAEVKEDSTDDSADADAAVANDDLDDEIANLMG